MFRAVLNDAVLGQNKARRRIAELQRQRQELAERRATSPASAHVDASLAGRARVGRPDLVAHARAATRFSNQAKAFARAADERTMWRKVKLVDVRLCAEHAAWRTATALATSAARAGQPATVPAQQDASSPAHRAA